MFETRSERRPRDTRAFRRLRVSRAPVRFALAPTRLAPKDNACSAGYFLDFFFHMKSGPVASMPWGMNVSGCFLLPGCWFARDVMAAMLVVKNKSISLLWELKSLIM